MAQVQENEQAQEQKQEKRLLRGDLQKQQEDDSMLVKE